LESVDNEAEQYFMSHKLSKIGITQETSKEDQKVAVLWALLASYLPEGIIFNT
jgi:hypothetical protein